ncbi:MAG: sensor histidine kinase, partial [Polyangiales bacterium]
DGRAGELNHVFLNLVDNAARAVGERGRVAIEGRIDRGAYVVTVGDSGPGIPEGQRERIFEPFWTTRPAGEGTGLGLSIAHQVVQRHGGTIDVGVSELGGALLTVRLPGARVQPAGRHHAQESARASSS